jgi:gamma-glutamylcyclotransferase (GGCT)/AIG2-like uncharacterized protein YtfP
VGARNAYVFAYGSNLDALQMRDRCPSAVLLACAWLKGHRLAFVGSSRRWGGCGVATVQRGRGRSAVAGAVYVMSPTDMMRLDRFEGTPKVYVRRKVDVLLEEGKVLTCWTYQHRSAELAEPAGSYVGRILRGYRALQLPKHAVHAAVSRARLAEMERPWVDGCAECGATWPEGAREEHESWCSVVLERAADFAAIEQRRLPKRRREGK